MRGRTLFAMTTSHALRIRRYAGWLGAGSTAAALLTLLGWGLGMMPDARPHLVVMAYSALQGVGLSALIVAALAQCHLSVLQAFSAGMSAGARLSVTAPEVSARPRLEVVD